VKTLISVLFGAIETYNLQQKHKEVSQ